MLMRKLENYLEGRIEGFFNKKFASSLRIEEVEHRLEKEFELKKREENGRVYAPDSYTFVFGEADYERLYGAPALCRLYRFILQSAIRRDFFFADKLQLQMTLNTIKDTGSFSVQALYQRDISAPPPEEDAASDATIVFEKRLLPKDAVDYGRVNFARLLVASGPDAGAALEIGMKRTHIGRRESNELPLRDSNCSRLHAYISYEDDRHVLCDAGSLNGTCVNRARVRRCVLRPGDQIAVGETVIVYEVD